MMPWTISRRSLIVTAVSGALACVSDYASFLTTRAGCTYSMVGHNELIALCSDLCCPGRIGKACLRALPTSESTRSPLARAILADVRLPRGKHPPPDLLAQAIKERSRADFHEGRVVTVDGWILSLTESRVYALTTLLPQTHTHVA